MQKLLPHLALLTANLIYGINYTVAKELMPHYIQPFGFILCRVTGAVVLFWITGFFIRERVHKKDFKKLLLCSLFGVTANQLMFFYGLNLTTPINAAIIMTSNPVLVLVVSSLLIKERITSTKITGIVLGMFGAILLIVMNQPQHDALSARTGDLFIFLNALSYGFYLVLVKPLMLKYHPFTIIKWVFTFGFLSVFPFGFQQFLQIEWESFTSNIWLAFAFVVIATTFIAYLLNITALKNLNPSVVSAYIYLQPFFASIVALYYGKDQLSFIKILSTVMIFTGVYLVSQTKFKLSK